jgi:phosphoglycerate dehydrogenase-like enzyme
MPSILCELPLEPSALLRLESLPGVTVRQVSFHERGWHLEPELLRGPEILLCKLPPRNVHDMPDLKWVQISTVGYEHLRKYDFANGRVRVCNARGIFDTAIGEWNVAMMIALVRDLRGMIRNQERSHWEKADRFQQEVRNRVVGLWGYGGIGRETARLAKALGLAVHVMTRSGVKPRHDAYTPAGTGDSEGALPDRVFTAGQEREFLSGLDFLILALPHTQGSDGMVGEAELQALPRTAFVLNPARGPIIREEALLKALREGWIAGAALDTHFAYPLPPEHPLWAMPNVILSPHVSGADRSREFPARIADLFTRNVERHLAGLPLLNELTRQEWLEA